MLAQTVQSVNFKGYDARPLYALCMRNTDGFALNKIASDMRQIGAKHGFKVLLEDKYTSDSADERKERQNGAGSLFEKAASFINGRRKEHLTSWMQDTVYFTKNGIIVPKNSTESFTPIAKTFNTEKRCITPTDFIPGGNLYIINDEGNEKILVGKDASTADVSKMFPGKEIVRIPQADFHIDLFVRPLKNNVILAADDDMTLEMLKKSADKLKKLTEENREDEALDRALGRLQGTIGQMEAGRHSSGYKDTKKVIQTLEENGFQVVKVPGRVYKSKVVFMGLDFSIINKLNFMNAIVFEDKNGELVYISNKSKLLDEMGISPELAKKIGLDFEEEFKKSIAEFVKPENVYFIEGDKQRKNEANCNIPYMLENLGGGIHCLCAEIPKETVQR